VQTFDNKWLNRFKHFVDKLEHLQSNNPKEYWKLINMLKEKSDDRPENSIDDQEWFNYFSHLSSIPNHILKIGTIKLSHHFFG
jgi:hypothetical protein